eukprot:4514131-Pleurochrysis_carterae.AAC.1
MVRSPIWGESDRPTCSCDPVATLPSDGGDYNTGYRATKIVLGSGTILYTAYPGTAGLTTCHIRESVSMETFIQIEVETVVFTP